MTRKPRQRFWLSVIFLFISVYLVSLFATRNPAFSAEEFVAWNGGALSIAAIASYSLALTVERSEMSDLLAFSATFMWIVIFLGLAVLIPQVAWEVTVIGFFVGTIPFRKQYVPKRHKLRSKSPKT